jgi:hypothetical protein
MDPVKTNAETFGSNVDRVSSALKTYAAEVEPIKAELAKIKADAYNFVASIAGGVEKTTYSRAGAIKSTVEWHEDQDSVDANNDLIHRVNAQMVLLWAAERKCANAIYDIIGFPHVEAATEGNPNGYGVTEIPDGAETPWGKTVERSESCGEKAVNAVGALRLGRSGRRRHLGHRRWARYSHAGLQPANRRMVQWRRVRGSLEQPRQAGNRPGHGRPTHHSVDRGHAWTRRQFPARLPDDGR